MADTKITALAAIGANPIIPSTFPLPMVDLTDTSMAASGTTKKVTVNQILGAGGTATLASATITGDLTVDTNVLKVDTSNNRVGFGTASPAAGATTSTVGTTSVSASNYTAGSTWAARFEAATNNQPSGIFLSGLTSGGLVVPGSLHVEPVAASSRSALIATYAADSAVGYFAINRFSPSAGTTTQHFKIADDGVATWSNVGGVAGTAMTLNSTGLGVGVAPSAWGGTWKVIEFNNGHSFSSAGAQSAITQNAYNNGTNWIYKTSSLAALYQANTGVHYWYNAPSGTAGNAITFTQAMTLTAGGELLIGATSGSGGRLWVQAAGSTEAAEIARLTASNTFNTLISYVVQAEGYNAGATALKVGKNTTTSRSINAGGTVNASGADYAEYMTKASDFVLAKGDVAGIDANGKLTNVFADAVSFVVKSTDPSYVGNDKWGVGLEGADLEAARQLVDRMAFAGQVPVNVTGAKAGDYIVPVVNGTGIKGQAVSNPTFEQYQLAVGKVISIDADGRARIIVKLA